MSQTSTKEITLTRKGLDHYLVTSKTSGATLEVGSDPGMLTPPEMLLASIVACTSIDIDRPASRHSEPEEFSVDVVAPVTVDDDGAHHLSEITCTWRIRYPDDEGGRRVTTMLPRLFKEAETHLCTVSITVAKGATITHTVTDGGE